jgi:hypothetical protein
MRTSKTGVWRSGSACRLQRRGHRFEPCHAHQPTQQVTACPAVVQMSLLPASCPPGPSPVRQGARAGVPGRAHAVRVQPQSTAPPPYAAGHGYAAHPAQRPWLPAARCDAGIRPNATSHPAAPRTPGPRRPQAGPDARQGPRPRPGGARHAGSRPESWAARMQIAADLGDDLHHLDHPLVQVDAAAAKSSHLTNSKAAIGTKQHQRPIAEQPQSGSESASPDARSSAAAPDDTGSARSCRHRRRRPRPCRGAGKRAARCTQPALAWSRVAGIHADTWRG